jgi:hypothetical protein
MGYQNVSHDRIALARAVRTFRDFGIRGLSPLPVLMPLLIAMIFKPIAYQSQS